MRRILIEQARRKARLKHGGNHQRQTMEQDELAIELPQDDLLAINEALQRLEAADSRKGQIVNMRYFAGMSTGEVAEALQVSVSTVEREWRYCRRWLFQQLSEDT